MAERRPSNEELIKMRKEREEKEEVESRERGSRQKGRRTGTRNLAIGKQVEVCERERESREMREVLCGEPLVRERESLGATKEKS